MLVDGFFYRSEFLWRWCLIAGVLAGLCFSSSEGIQLLPFPVTAGERDSSDISFEGAIFKSYSLPVHNSSANFGKNGVKAQKNLKFFGSAAISRRAPQNAKFLRRVVVQNNAQPTICKGAGLTAKPSDRAPPFA